MTLSISSRIRLNNGVDIPVLGFGTLRMGGETAQKAVLWALDAGYRHIDTAKAYGNEDDIGKALQESSIPREELFITTKLWNDDHGYTNTLAAIDRSLKNLKMDRVDLYLVHWPGSGRRVETWKAMEKILREGKARAIGVSNFTIRHIEEILTQTEIVPAVNQIEFTPYLYQKQLQDYCEGKGIKIEAWSPLTRGIKLGDPKLVEIADRYRKSPAQILIRWGLQHGVISIPKSEHRERIIENSKVFDFNISEKDMKRLDGFNENLRTSGWDPYSDMFK
jgi:diketogulonate reductase-like aldo/keto reductase